MYIYKTPSGRIFEIPRYAYDSGSTYGDIFAYIVYTLDVHKKEYFR